MIEQHETWRIIDSTKLQDFISCPRKYFYRYILGWVGEEDNVHLVMGSAIHKAHEIMLQNGYSPDVVELAILEMTRMYRQAFSEQMDDVYYPKSPGYAAEMLRRYAKHFSDDFQKAEVIYTEISGSVPIRNDRVMYFKTDSILKGVNGHYQNKYFSREHKTTKSDSRQWRDQWSLKTQIGTYNHVLYCLYQPDQVYGVEINGMIFQKSFAKKSQDELFPRIAIIKGPTAMQDWLWTVNNYYDEIERETERMMEVTENDNIMRAWPKNTESCSIYSGCPYMDYCCSWHNPLRRAEDLPQGMERRFWNPTEQETTHKMEIS